MVEQQKADVVLNWIPHGLVRVHFDARRLDVRVPRHLRKQANVVLEWGFNLPRPIVDLKIDQEAISGTLSFGGSTAFCMLRWAAVFCVTSPTLDKVAVWLNDAPGEVQREVLERAGNAANKKIQRQRLRVVK
jgi:hypothetical protein